MGPKKAKLVHPPLSPAKEAEEVSEESMSCRVESVERGLDRLTLLEEIVMEIRNLVLRMEKKLTETGKPPDPADPKGKAVAIERMEEGGGSVMFSPPGFPSMGSRRPPTEENRVRTEDLGRRMEIPLFDGNDAEDWVIRVDQYFELGNYQDWEKMEAVRMCFVEEALRWYRWERDRNPFRS